MSEAKNVQNREPARVRVRVRTPGKHIVLFSLAVTFMIGVSTLILSKADLPLSPQPFAAAPKTFEETFVTDLAPDAQGRLRLLKIIVEIGAPDAATQGALDEKRAVVRERIAFFLRELTPEDLDGAPALERLKSEMKRRVDLSLAPDAASDVIVRSIVIQ